MRDTRLILIGGGEHARVVCEAARSSSCRFDVVGFIDPAPRPDTERAVSLPWLGNESVLPDYVDCVAVLAVGATTPSLRRTEVVERLGKQVERWSSVVHSEAWVSPTAKIDPGAVIMAGAVVNAGARVGRHAVVNTGAVVEHDVVLGRYAVVAPGAVIGGGVIVGDGAIIGLGSRVRDHVLVGEHAMVGMGAVVVDSVAARTTVVGAPAREANER